jgi:hypothetical protein
MMTRQDINITNTADGGVRRKNINDIIGTPKLDPLKVKPEALDILEYSIDRWN